MYATSKLIIPAKIAQDSPYVPKIRICLRPSPSLDKNSDMGSSLGSVDLMSDTLEQSYNEHNIGDQCGIANATSNSPHNGTEKMLESSQDPVRGSRKRKMVGNVGNIDFERRDSLLTKINLKKLINVKTFEALPLESRRRLLSLLPLYDQTPPTDSTSVVSASSDYWIHPTALNNEFLSKALQDYSTRQMNGDFAPRVNARTGLRKSVGNRQRYSTPILSPTSLSGLPSRPQTSELNTKDKCDTPSLITSGSQAKVNGVTGPISRLRNKCDPLQSKSTTQSVETKTENEDGDQQEGIGTRLSRRRKAIAQSAFSPFVSPSSSSSTTSSPPSPHCHSSSSPSSGFSPTTAGAPGSMAPLMPLSSVPTSESERPVLRPSPVSSEPPTLRRLSMPKLESTLLLQNGAKPSSELSLSSRRSTIGTPGRRLSHSGSEFHSSGRHHLVVDSSTPATPTTMPPPRETKTLASVREKLRAKRMMMGQQHLHHPPQNPPPTPSGQLPLPLPSLASVPLPDPPPSGSLTPNPGTSYSGDFYSCPNAIQDSAIPVSAPALQPPTAAMPLMGNSVSAPATPQHGSAGGGIPGPLPAILAHFKQARVVVTPSRSVSGSSVSSNEGGQEVAEADHQSSDAHSQLQIVQQQQPSVTVSTNGSGVGGNGGSTTTRAFLVDGNNLSETLALLQSMNPRATVTQQQFLLIPSTDKSHAILCRTPIAIQPKQAPPSQTQVVRRHSGFSPCPASSTPAPTVLPLILPANRPQDQQQQASSIPHGLYREILPNNGNSNVCGVQRVHPHHQQQQAQVRPTQTYYSLLAPSSVTASNANNNSNNQPTSFLPPPT
ncbi:unnamed protein product [Mesocestoides corti]|uniref:ASXH domain-containing protein n=1 Tax=Mesocestoides corti TaxID=53468 RepID=A0A158QTR9_MESCO|nr:unnamed protein product [Mesocestoides corti]